MAIFMDRCSTWIQWHHCQWNKFKDFSFALFLMCRDFKAVLAVHFVFFIILSKIYIYEKETTYFRLECNKGFQHLDKYWIFTHSINEHIYLLATQYILIPRFSCNPKEMIFNISSVCFKITYLMTNQSFFSTFKSNIFLTKNRSLCRFKNH